MGFYYGGLSESGRDFSVTHSSSKQRAYHTCEAERKEDGESVRECVREKILMEKLRA